MNRRNAARLGIAIVGVLLLQACVEDTPALFIVHNSTLDDGCEPVTRGNPLQFQSAGAMDLTVATSYVMFPLVENLMSPSGSVSLGGNQGGTTSGGGLYEGNRVTLSSATVSFRPPSGFDVTMPRNLRIPISGTLEPNGDVVTGLTVINNALGQQLRASAQLQERGAQVPIEVELRFNGTSTSGKDLDSNTFTYPLTVCNGCLLIFPPEANDPLDTQPNCRADLSDESTVISDFEQSCFPGQDAPLDCRVCRIITTSQGASDQQVEQLCEPAPSAGI